MSQQDPPSSWNLAMVPQLIIEVMEFAYLQLSAGVRPADLLVERKDSSAKKRAFSIRRKVAKRRRVDYSKYKPAEVFMAMVGCLKTSPIIAEDISPCFSAAICVPEMSHACMRGLLNQLLPYERNLLHALVHFSHRLVSEFHVPSDLLAQRLGEATIQRHPAESETLPADVFRYLVANYEALYVRPQAAVNIARIVERVPDQPDEGADEESDDASAFGTMIIRHTPQPACNSPTRNNPFLAATLSSSTSNSTNNYNNHNNNNNYNNNRLADSSSPAGTMIVHDDSPAHPSAASLFPAADSPAGTMIVREDSPPRRSAAALFSGYAADDDPHSSSSSSSSPCGTMVVRDSSPPRSPASALFSDPEGTMVVRPLQQPQKGAAPPKSASTGSAQGKISAAYREPEAWEKNIILLEKGEWGEALSVDAFRRWNKQRPRLPSFRVRPTPSATREEGVSSDSPLSGSQTARPSLGGSSGNAGDSPLEEPEVNQLLKEMNLPNTAGSVRLVKNIARASAIFKSYAQFAEEADQSKAEGGKSSAAPQLSTSAGQVPSAKPRHGHLHSSDLSASASDGEKKPSRRSRSKGRSNPKSLPKNNVFTKLS